MYVRSVEDIPTLPINRLHINNMVDNDLQALLRPLNLVPRLLFCASYRIRHNFICPNSFLYNVLVVFYFVSFRCLALYTVIYLCIYIVDFHGGSKIFFTLFDCLDFTIFSIGFLINTYVCFKESDNNILLILKIQYVLRNLNVSRLCLKSLIASSWWSVILIHAFFIVSGTYYCYYFSELRITDVLTQYPTILFDVNVIYASLLIKLLEKTLRVWIEAVQKQNIDNSERERHLEMLFDVYFNIQGAYKIIDKTFQIQVNIYFHVLLIIKNVMTMLLIKNYESIKNIKYFVLVFISQTWLLKSIVVFIYLSVECERFYAAMRDVHDTSIMLMNSEQFAELDMRVYKNIHRARRSLFSKLDGCRLFQVDAELPLQLSRLISSYIIVCLQFAFL
ncbi:hypothetical protein B5X24_HaOG201001 [Helicoverpa armigera]|nr:hypothetical protein B5X24_HaOG201001 [Helicoverpa armigera]